VVKIDVKKVSDLAQIPLTKEELEKYQIELEKIIAFVEKLDEVDTTNVEPTNQVTGIANSFHDDTIDSSIRIQTEDSIKNANESDGSYIITKGVFDER